MKDAALCADSTSTDHVSVGTHKSCIMYYVNVCNLGDFQQLRLKSKSLKG